MGDLRGEPDGANGRALLELDFLRRGLLEPVEVGLVFDSPFDGGDDVLGAAAQVEQGAMLDARARRAGFAVGFAQQGLSVNLAAALVFQAFEVHNGYPIAHQSVMSR